MDAELRPHLTKCERLECIIREMPQTKEFLSNLDLTRFPESSFCLTIEEYLTTFSPPHNEVNDAIFEELKTSVRERIKSGLDLQSQASVPRIPTGCRGLDWILDGGLRRGSVTEIYGASSTGKTQFCHLIAARTASSGAVVIYIDSINTFCPNRIVDFAQPDPKETKQLLSLVKVFRIHNAYTLLHLIDRITAEMSEMDNPESKPLVIVIDSISGILSPVLNALKSEGPALVSAVGRGLRCLADEEQICVFLTNHEVSSWKAPPNPNVESGQSAMGASWHSQVHSRIAIREGRMERSVISKGDRSVSIQINEHSIDTIESNSTNGV